jgi:hypothetical protein
MGIAAAKKRNQLGTPAFVHREVVPGEIGIALPARSVALFKLTR